MKAPSHAVHLRAMALLGALAALVALNVPVLSQGGGQPGGPRVELARGRNAAAGEVLVKLRRPLAAGEMAQLELQVDAEANEGLNSLGVRRFRSRRFDVETLLAFFLSLPEVEYAEPNYIVSTTAPPNDPQFGSLWGLFNTTTPGADIGAVPAWDISTGSANQVVGIVDTGIDYAHPDLAANVWSAPAAFTVVIGGASITCAAGTHGFNGITNTCNPQDDHYHGTHVAGTVGAVGNNGVGVVGVNWNVRLMGLKFLSASGSGSTADAIKVMEFAIQAKQIFAATNPINPANVRVLSNSWGGGGFSQSLLDEINKANTNDMLFVAAAGNSNVNTDVTPHYPSAYTAPNVISVAATTSTDARASFSNYGAASVDLGAPGSGILSTYYPGNGYALASGTSMATPHVAGAAALVLSECSMGTAALKTLILDSVDVIPALAGITVTGGRLNVNTAIRACAPSSPTAPLPPATLTATAGNAQVALGWSASSGADSYRVYRSTVSGGPYAIIGSGFTGTSHTDTGVTNGTTYYYVVSAVNAVGASADSIMASATPALPSAPAVPTGLTARANGKRKIDLAWNASSGATNYNVRRSTTSGGGYTPLATAVTVRTFSDRTVVSGVTYYYVVSAVNAGGVSGDSNPPASAKAR